MFMYHKATDKTCHDGCIELMEWRVRVSVLWNWIPIASRFGGLESGKREWGDCNGCVFDYTYSISKISQ